MISVKSHEGGVVSLCDSDLLGKHFEDAKHSLSITKSFYKGEYMTKKKVIQVLKDAPSLNLVGKNIVGIALEEGFIKEKDIITIQGVPHVQIYTV